MARKQIDFIPLVIAVITIIAIVMYIVRRNENSGLASAVRWVSDRLEGFAVSPTTAIRCPQGWKFFNNSAGGSFCCGGEVNPYNGTCSDASKMCAFEPNVKDPRGPTFGALPLCKAVADGLTNHAQSSFCPRNLPNYALKGKCCNNSTTVDGEDCSPLDLADKKRYCVVNNPKSGEQSCRALKMAETGSCPAGMKRVSYRLGEAERARYGSVTDGMVMPICTNVQNSCIPEEAVKEAQKMGIYKDKDVKKWLYSCAGYETRFVKRDASVKLDTTYL